MLFNMFLLKKADTDKFNKILNTISTVLEDIYTETKKIGEAFDELNKSIDKKASNTYGNTNSTFNGIDTKNYNITGMLAKIAPKIITRLLLMETAKFAKNSIEKLPALQKVKFASGALPANNKLALTATITKLIYKGLPFLITAELVGGLSDTYKDRYTAGDLLSRELGQSFSTMDNLLITFDVEAGVDYGSLANFLMGLKNGGTVEDSPIYNTLKDLGIEVYDKDGKMNNMAEILAKLSNALESKTEKQAAEIKLALGMDSNIFTFLQKGKENFTKSSGRLRKYTRDENPKVKQIAEEKRKSITENKYALREVATNFSQPFSEIGDFVTVSQNKARDAFTSAISDHSVYGLFRMFFNDKLDKDGIKALEPTLIKASETMSSAQQASQAITASNSQFTTTNNNHISNQNTFNIASNNPEEVGRIVDQKMRSMNQDAGEYFNDGRLA